MPTQEEMNQEIEQMKQRAKENVQTTKAAKKESTTKKIVRMVLMYGALALILAVVVMAFINKR